MPILIVLIIALFGIVLFHLFLAALPWFWLYRWRRTVHVGLGFTCLLLATLAFGFVFANFLNETVLPMWPRVDGEWILVAIVALFGLLVANQSLFAFALSPRLRALRWSASRGRSAHGGGGPQGGPPAAAPAAEGEREGGGSS